MSLRESDVGASKCSVSGNSKGDECSGEDNASDKAEAPEELEQLVHLRMCQSC